MLTLVCEQFLGLNLAPEGRLVAGFLLVACYTTGFCVMLSRPIRTRQSSRPLIALVLLEEGAVVGGACVYGFVTVLWQTLPPSQGLIAGLALFGMAWIFLSPALLRLRDELAVNEYRRDRSPRRRRRRNPSRTR